MNLQLKPNNTNPEPKLNIDYNALLFSKDGEPAKYYCPTANCKRSFKHKNQLQFHLRNQCGKPPRYKCPYCGYQSQWKQHARVHIQRVHPEQLPEVIDTYKSFHSLKY
ncbi:longitudinals lacking protein, isoforms A/B/D/L-like isoform X2 [Cotesia typhae]|uniref:longitudinals lacking protein, isoforms A/B/D/L-like isoform X2 n=1 Tax=Cotesia typhae TaxID=2053667 RepID=UPI003D69FDBA